MTIKPKSREAEKNMKKNEITNTYHDTVETVWAKSLENAKTENEILVSITAGNLADNEVERD